MQKKKHFLQNLMLGVFLNNFEIKALESFKKLKKCDFWEYFDNLHKSFLAQQ